MIFCWFGWHPFNYIVTRDLWTEGRYVNYPVVYKWQGSHWKTHKCRFCKWEWDVTV